MTPAHLFGPRTKAWIIPALLVVGLTLRGYHYLRGRAVWQDEAGLLLTVAARGFDDLFLGRLDYHQAAPPLYLCVLRTMSLLFGDSSYALRLPSFLAGCAALLLFVPVARRWLVPRAVPWAVLLFAGSEQLLWHASEAKAYSVDVLAAVVVLAGAKKSRVPFSLALLAPLLLLSSYPACFLCTGVLLAYLPVVYRRKQGRDWLAYGALTATTGVTALWLMLGPVRCQHDAEIHSCWVACMPDWERPWTVPVWMLSAPFEVCRYCAKPLGQILAILTVPGTLALWRRGERRAVLLMTAPIALTLAAACVHRYPFGGVRVLAYATPAVLLLAAAGVPPAFAWLASHSPLSRTRGRGVGGEGATLPLTPNPSPPSTGERGERHNTSVCRSFCSKLACAVLAGLLVLPLASSLEQIVHPWREADVPAAAAYVRAQRQPEDFILGNDVAQQYYFRRLSSAFHLLDESPPPARGDRLWVVMTAALSRKERVRLAGQLAPPGWHALQQREFAYTTVILFSR